MVKLYISKKKELRNGTHYRFYPANEVSFNKIGITKCVIDISGEDSRYYNCSYIRTEKELCRFIYYAFGPGI